MTQNFVKTSSNTALKLILLKKMDNYFLTEKELSMQSKTNYPVYFNILSVKLI